MVRKVIAMSTFRAFAQAHLYIYICICCCCIFSFLSCHTLKKRWGEREAHLNVSREAKREYAQMHKCIQDRSWKQIPMSEKMGGTWERTYNVHCGLEWVN